METYILPPLLNREFKLPADGFFQFAPLGEYPIQDPVTKNRVIQVVDAEAVSLMAADIARQKAKANWPGLLVDRDHFSYDNTKESRAAGWANEALARPDGLFGQIRFTNSGKADVEGGEFRFLSPVFDRQSAVDLGAGRFRVTRLLGLALTNTPNLRGIAALSNREESFHGREATTTDKNPNMNKVIVLLGLAANTTEDEVVSKVQALKNRVAELEPIQGQLATLQGTHTALKNRHDSLLSSSVEKTLVEYKGVITEESKDAWKNRLTSNFDGTIALLKGIKAPAAGGKGPVHKDGKHADVVVEGGDAFKNRETNITKRANELYAANSARGFDACWQQARNENPPAAE